MGGVGSGRHRHWNARATTDSMRRLDVRKLARCGHLKPGMWFGWQWSTDGERTADIRIETQHGSIILAYRHQEGGGDWESLRYPVRLLSQPCHLGGERQWFACPVRGCGRRVAILYGGRIFACRQCHNLAFPSQREKPFQRYQRRANTVKARLGWNERPWMDWGPKPKGMQKRSFERLTAEIIGLEDASEFGFARYFSEHYSDILP